jgi:hypothetical protein
MGQSWYRGNCSVHVYWFRGAASAHLTNPMVGGGTSVEVAREMGIEVHGLDLHWDLTASSSAFLRPWA